MINEALKLIAVEYRGCFVSPESWRRRRTWQSGKVRRGRGNKGTPSIPVGYLPTLPVGEENTKVLAGTAKDNHPLFSSFAQTERNEILHYNIAVFVDKVVRAVFPGVPVICRVLRQVYLAVG